ncbi:MAG: FitA-like ribbon-helix-helix domain-containing protein [Alkalispirochaeta sp.]
MKSLHIRDVDERVLENLHRLARAHHRSVQGEVRAILEAAARYAPPHDIHESLDLVTTHTGRETPWSRNDIYADDAR